MRKSSKRINDADYIGKVFNSLTVLSMEDVNGLGKARKALCKCQCGNYVKVALHDLRTGHNKSCGCLKKQRIIEYSTTHGMSRHPLTPIYAAIMQRCNNPKNKRYNDYGGRGISVCEEWSQDISSFFKWALENGWESGLDIDREDNNGNYGPDNCRIVPRIINQRNKRNSKLICYKGQIKSLPEWCELLNLNCGSVRSRFSRNKLINPAEAFEKPFGRWPSQQRIITHP